jgi:hypothetical protein
MGHIQISSALAFLKLLYTNTQPYYAMYDYIISFLWWFMWTPFYIQITCFLVALFLVIMPLMSSFRFEDIMACLSVAGVIFILIS